MKEEYMRATLREAEKAKKIDEVPIGCVIVKDDKIIARGHNLRETKQQSINHAEIIAIQKACKKVGSWRLEVQRFICYSGALLHVCRCYSAITYQNCYLWNC